MTAWTPPGCTIALKRIVNQFKPWQRRTLSGRRAGHHTLTDYILTLPGEKRKRRIYVQREAGRNLSYYVFIRGERVNVDSIALLAAIVDSRRE